MFKTHNIYRFTLFIIILYLINSSYALSKSQYDGLWKGVTNQGQKVRLSFDSNNDTIGVCVQVWMNFGNCTDMKTAIIYFNHRKNKFLQSPYSAVFNVEAQTWKGTWCFYSSICNKSGSGTWIAVRECERIYPQLSSLIISQQKR